MFGGGRKPFIVFKNFAIKNIIKTYLLIVIRLNKHKSIK